MRRLVLATMLAGVLTGAPPAAAQDLFPVGEDIFHNPVANVRITQLPVTAAGSLAVEWEADPATCAAVGRCGLRGTATWRLPRRGELLLFEGRRGGRPLRGGYLVLTGDFPGDESAVTARVRRPGGLCADAGSGAGFVEIEEAGGLVSVGIGEMGSSLLVSRCAGPMLDDVARALPVVRVPFRQLRRGRTRVAVDGDGAFEGHGLRGTARSDLELRIGAPRREDQHADDHPGRRHRVRYVSNQFRVRSVSGEIGLDVAGATASHECTPLDSCGVAGTLRLMPSASEGDANLTAYGPARYGRRAARAAVGLAPGGVRPGFRVFGSVAWEGEGRVEASIGRAGEPPCTDAVELPEGYLGLGAEGDRVRVEFLAAPTDLRTRCPGPLGGYEPALASGEVPLRAFRRRRVEVRLTSGTSLPDDGWTVRTRPALTVVLERARILERVVREPLH